MADEVLSFMRWVHWIWHSTTCVEKPWENPVTSYWGVRSKRASDRMHPFNRRLVPSLLTESQLLTGRSELEPWDFARQRLKLLLAVLTPTRVSKPRTKR